MKKQQYNERFFESWSNDMAYILGFIMGDGNIGINDSRNYYLQIHLHRQDECILKFILNNIAPQRNIIYYTQAQKSGKITPKCCIKITSNKICNDLAKLYIVPQKTGKEKLCQIPDIYKSYYLLGLFDADGSIKKKKYRFSINSANKQFLENVQKQLGLSLGKIYIGHGCWSWEINKRKDISQIGKLMYEDGNRFCLHRKKIIFDQMPKPVLYFAFGEHKTLAEWNRDIRCCVTYDTIKYRLKYTDLTFEEILTANLKSRYKNMYHRNKKPKTINRFEVYPIEQFPKINY